MNASQQRSYSFAQLGAGKTADINRNENKKIVERWGSVTGWGKRTPIAVINFQINSGPDRYSISAYVKAIGGWNERPFVTASGWIIPWEIFIPLSCYPHVFHGFIKLFVPFGIIYIGWGPNRCNRWNFFFCLGCSFSLYSFFFSVSLCCSFG